MLRFSGREFHAHVGWILLLMLLMGAASAFGWAPKYDAALAARSGGVPFSGFEGLENMEGDEEVYEDKYEAEGDYEASPRRRSALHAERESVKGAEVEMGEEGGGSGCPDMLVKSNGIYYLYHTQREKVPGVNPIRFSGLEEYREYVEWQRMSEGKRCPVLQVEETMNAQGGVSYVDPRLRVHNPPSMLAPSSWQDVASRSESVMRFDRDHDQLCGDGSIVHPQFCIRDRERFDSLNRSSGYKASLDGPTTSDIAGSGIYAYDPDNQYIGLRTERDKDGAGERYLR